VPYFATKVLLGPTGVTKIMGTGEIDAFEKNAFEAMLAELKGSIKKGIEFVKNPPAPSAEATHPDGLAANSHLDRLILSLN
jgi:malate dehydrogenase